MKFFWLLTLIASVIAGIVLWTTFSTAKSAPQEAAGAAIAIGIAVIPYIFTRAITELAGDEKEEKLPPKTNHN